MAIVFCLILETILMALLFVSVWQTTTYVSPRRAVNFKSSIVLLNSLIVYSWEIFFYFGFQAPKAKITHYFAFPISWCDTMGKLWESRQALPAARGRLVCSWCEGWGAKYPRGCSIFPKIYYICTRFRSWTKIFFMVLGNEKTPRYRSDDAALLSCVLARG